MTDKHTPGLWHTSELHASQFRDGKRIAGPDGVLIATVNTSNPANNYGEANARLISLAPFIPELTEMVQFFVDHAPNQEESPRIFAQCRALLSRINSKGGE